MHSRKESNDQFKDNNEMISSSVAITNKIWTDWFCWQSRICVVTDPIRFWQFLFWVYLNLMYFDLKCDAECNFVNVGCLGVSVINVP